MDKYSLAYLKKLLAKKRIQEDDPKEKFKEYEGGKIVKKQGGGVMPEYEGGERVPKTSEGEVFKEYIGGERVPKTRQRESEIFKEYIGGERVPKTSEGEGQGISMLYSRAGKAQPRNNFSVDNNDITEKLYQDWLRTGVIKSEGGDALRLHNNTLIREFVKRRKKEQGK